MPNQGALVTVSHAKRAPPSCEGRGALFIRHRAGFDPLKGLPKIVPAVLHEFDVGLFGLPIESLLLGYFPRAVGESFGQAAAG